MRVVYSLLAVLCLLSRTTLAGEIRATFAMDADPEVYGPAMVKFYSSAYKPLWLQALARPEADLQRLAAETISQAHAFGFPDLIEARPRLLEILQTSATPATTRFAAARALIVLDSRESAAELLRASNQHGGDLRQLIEPKLGHWTFKPAGEVWRERLTAKNVRHRDLTLAIDGVAQLGDSDAVPLLLKIVRDRLRAPSVRLSAARSAGLLKQAELESEIAALASDGMAPILERLCAVHLLAHHSSPEAKTLLARFAVDPEPSVAVVALGQLLKLDPDLVVPLADQAMLNLDSNVRQRGAEAYLARPTPERVVKLVRLLDDPHPTIRGNVREALFLLTKTPEFDSVLRPAILNMLGEVEKVDPKAGELSIKQWRGQEQAALLLGTLDQESAAPRLVQLLESPRPEVAVTAAWALRKLAVTETLPAILDKAQRQTAVREKEPFQPEALDAQVVHLFEAMGLMKYAPAEPLLRKYVPKSFGLGNFSRGAAVWALGHLYANKPDEELVKLLAERMADVRSIPPEVIHVQSMSAISLGRMQAKSEVKKIRELMGEGLSPHQPNLALRWALVQLTGETLPELVPDRYSKSNWFLAPLDETPKGDNK